MTTAALAWGAAFFIAGSNLPCQWSDRHGGYRAESCPLLQPEHEKHRLIAHFAKFRRIYECGLGVPTKPRQDCNILLAANLKGHGRSVEACADIDLPKLFKADVVIGSE